MKASRRGGQALVEMALITPLLMLMLIAVVDFGRAAYVFATLSAAVREGARVAVLTGTSRPGNGQVIAAVQRNAIGLSMSPGICLNDPVPPAPAMTANTGRVYVGAGLGNATSNAPGGQPAAPAGGGCGAVRPSLAGHYALTVTVKYRFQPLTPLAAQFLPAGILITVSSTMNTEY